MQRPEHDPPDERGTEQDEDNAVRQHLHRGSRIWQQGGKKLIGDELDGKDDDDNGNDPRQEDHSGQLLVVLHGQSIH